MECDVPDKCDGNGNCESYRHGHEIKTACQFYSPMPDVESLLALADEMEQETGSVCGVCMGKSARRIRKALGVTDA